MSWACLEQGASRFTDCQMLKGPRLRWGPLEPCGGGGSKRMLASPAARGKVPQNRVRVDQYVRDRIIMCRGVAPCAACQRAHFGHHLQQRVGHLSETAADGRSECVCGCFVVAWSWARCRPTGMPTVDLVWREAVRESHSSLPHRQGNHRNFLPPWT